MHCRCQIEKEIEYSVDDNVYCIIYGNIISIVLILRTAVLEDFVAIVSSVLINVPPK